ncbi:MAG: hypothetical protein Q7W05_07240 [Deltaproteobacteria bacterium]|jgi:hypothetical protein|nr:hypothetical protein [Deltaproteobacteria bacterium]
MDTQGGDAASVNEAARRAGKRVRTIHFRSPILVDGRATSRHNGLSPAMKGVAVRERDADKEASCMRNRQN